MKLYVIVNVKKYHDRKVERKEFNEGALLQVYSDVGQDNDDEICILCHFGFRPNDNVFQLDCKHIFHSECFNQYLSIGVQDKNV